ncbi:2'-5' RNA ligase family protein [Nocardioides sp. GY 10113]|uniref:2'-5' RNA ligase family protein n=1 Tax=Nocardioides sp. GY 10113 TaxID=2569761 RepID=UPI0010A7BD47|nr:2'-5' RNA ligase family protein [Nocardioides sp. GY 10113]TIC88558.1 2'-5' RNA ligase family protein [Nocardioides sp. GY 10113]
MGHSVLVVPVPALEPFVRARWAHYDPAWVSADPAFTHAHVTALSPWREDPDPDALARVARIAAATPAFDFTLAAVDAFPDGTLHTPPAPAAPFADLTARLWSAFPDCPPYGGAFGEGPSVPHVTLDRVADDVSVASVRTALGGTLPAACRAEALEWHWYDEGDCHVRGRWPFRAPPSR